MKKKYNSIINWDGKFDTGFMALFYFILRRPTLIFFLNTIFPPSLPMILSIKNIKRIYIMPKHKVI